MELDRSEVNINVAVDTDLGMEKQEKVRKPHKRFIGQRAAAARAEGKHSSVAIEENGAIQGTRRPIHLQILTEIYQLLSPEDQYEL